MQFYCYDNVISEYNFIFDIIQFINFPDLL